MQVALSHDRWTIETSVANIPAGLVADVDGYRPHVVLLSVPFGCTPGIGLIEGAVSSGPTVVVLTAERRRPMLGRFLEAGAVGWIGRDTGLDDVIAGLLRVVDGLPLVAEATRVRVFDALRQEREIARRERACFDDLTDREAHVLAAMTDGLTADEIATEHFVAVCTIRSQIRAVLQKLNVRSQLAAVAIAAAHRELLPSRDACHSDRRHVHHDSEVIVPDTAANTPPQHGLAAARPNAVPA